MLASKAETKPWLTIAQSPPICFLPIPIDYLMKVTQLEMDWLNPMENEGVWKILNPIDNPPKTAVLLAHGKDDADVPISQSETYYRVMKAKDCDIQKLWLNGDHYP